MTTNLRRVQFSPSPIPTLAAIAVVALTVYLGQWQQGRAGEKRMLQAEFDARAGEPAVELGAGSRDAMLRYRQAVARGEWVGTGQIFIDNKVSHETAGYHVIAPLKLVGSESYVLVNRGWIARAPSYPLPPQVDVPPGQVQVTGLLSTPSSRFLELSPQSVQGKVWQNLTIERYRDASKLDVLPFVLLAHDSAAPLEKITERPDAGAAKHVEYMLTWYSLAATVVVLWLVLNTRIIAKSNMNTDGTFTKLKRTERPGSDVT